MAIYIGSKKVGRDVLTQREAGMAGRAGASSSSIKASQNTQLNLSSKQKAILKREGVPQSEWDNVYWVDADTYRKVEAYSTVSGGTTIIDDKLYLRKDKVAESLAAQTTMAKMAEATERERITQQWDKKKFISQAAEDTRRTHEFYINQRRGEARLNLGTKDYTYTGGLTTKISRSPSGQESMVPDEYRMNPVSSLNPDKQKGLVSPLPTEQRLTARASELKTMFKESLPSQSQRFKPAHAAVGFVSANAAYAAQIGYGVIKRPGATALSLVNPESYIEGAEMLATKTISLDPTLATDILVMKGTGKLGGKALNKVSSLIEKTPFYEPPETSMVVASQTSRQFFGNEKIIDTTGLAGQTKAGKVTGVVTEVWSLEPEGGYTSKIQGQFILDAKKPVRVSIVGKSNTYLNDISKSLKVTETSAIFEGGKKVKVVDSLDITEARKTSSGVSGMSGESYGFQMGKREVKEVSRASINQGTTNLDNALYRSYTTFDSAMVLESRKPTLKTRFEGGDLLILDATQTDQLWYTGARSRTTSRPKGMDVRPVPRGLEFKEYVTLESAAKQLFNDKGGQLRPRSSPLEPTTRSVIGEKPSPEKLIDTKDYVQRYIGEASKESMKPTVSILPRAGSIKSQPIQSESDLRVINPEVTKPMAGISTALSSRTLQIYNPITKPIQSSRSFSDVLPISMQRTRTFQGQKQITDQLPISQSITTTSSVSQPRTPTTPTPGILAPFSPPAPFYGSGGTLFNPKTPKRGYAYAPSVEALIFNITGTAPKRISGLEFRPMRKSGRRRN